MGHSQEESCRGAASERSRRQCGVLQTMLRIWDVIPKVVNHKRGQLAHLKKIGLERTLKTSKKIFRVY